MNKEKKERGFEFNPACAVLAFVWAMALLWATTKVGQPNYFPSNGVVGEGITNILMFVILAGKVAFLAAIPAFLFTFLAIVGYLYFVPNKSHEESWSRRQETNKLEGQLRSEYPELFQG